MYHYGTDICESLVENSESFLSHVYLALAVCDPIGISPTSLDSATEKPDASTRRRLRNHALTL